MFSHKSQLKTRNDTAEERWMNNRHTFWLKSRAECIHIRGKDIECCWTESKDLEATDNEYMIRTKSGKDFSLRFEDWLKVVHEDENFK